MSEKRINIDTSSILKSTEERTILEEVNDLLLSYAYEMNYVKTRESIVNTLDQYFKHRMPKRKFIFTDETGVKDVAEGGYKIMVKTPFINLGEDGNMLLSAFLKWVTEFEFKERVSKQYVRHSMELSLIVSKRLRKIGKKGKYIDELLGEGMAAKIKGGTSDLTTRQLATLEVALGIDLVRDFSNKELGLKL